MDSDSNHILSISINQLGHWLSAVTKTIATAVDINNHGQLVGPRRRIDIQEETVLVAWDEWSTRHGEEALRARWAKGIGLNDGAVDVWETGDLPAQVTRQRPVDRQAVGIGGIATVGRGELDGLTRRRLAGVREPVGPRVQQRDAHRLAALRIGLDTTPGIEQLGTAVAK